MSLFFNNSASLPAKDKEPGAEQSLAASLSTKSNNQTKPWFFEGTQSRILPFDVIPRDVNQKKYSRASEGGEGGDSDDDDDDDDDNDAGSARSKSRDSEDAENRLERKSSHDENSSILDYQVKKLLNRPANNDFGSKKFRQFHHDRDLFSVNDSNAPPKASLVAINDYDHDMGTDQGDGKKGTLSDDKSGETGELKTETFNAFNYNFGSEYASRPINKNSNDIFASNVNVGSISSLFYDKMDVPKKKSVGYTEDFAILVYGYRESDSLQIIQYFSKFGEILEDFEVLNKANLFGSAQTSSVSIETDEPPFVNSSLNDRNKSKNKNVENLDKVVSITKLPIYLGPNWIKLTFSNKASYTRALKENNTVFNDDYKLFVKPFSNELLTTLKTQNCKVEFVNGSADNEAAKDTQRPGQQEQQTATAADTNFSIFSTIQSFGSIFDKHNDKKARSLSGSDPNPKPEKKAKFEDHKIPIINKQMLFVKDKAAVNKKKALDIDLPSKNSNQSWLAAGLDYAFGLNSL